MAEPRDLGYLIPQFPGQTHIFFWRELKALETLGFRVVLMSTRKPPAGVVAHDWSAAAMARTLYLGAFGIGDVLAGWARLVPVLPWADLRREGPGFVKDLLISAPAAWRLMRAARTRGFAHVHVHSCGRAALIAALARLMGGPAYSLTLHGGIQDYGSGQRFKWRGAAYGLVVTRALLPDLAAALGPDMPARIAAAPMGVETEVLKRSAPYEPARPGQAIRLFTCARLNRFKGHQDLLHVMRGLIDEGQQLSLEIAGEDDDGGHGYRRELEALIVELGLSDHVRLLGAIDASAVKDRLEAAHVFVLASWREALSVAYMEAMSMGLPVIATDVGGTRELIEDGVTGLLIAPQDHAALRAALLRLAGDPDLALRLGSAARAHVEAGFHASVGAEVLMREIDR